jgi:hypothetical protein
MLTCASIAVESMCYDNGALDDWDVHSDARDPVTENAPFPGTMRSHSDIHLRQTVQWEAVMS